MSSFYSDASLVMIPSGYKTSKVYCAKPTDGAADLSFSRSNDTATRVGPDGLIEKVRTNLITYSEDWTNAAWTKTNATVTANATTNPIDGASTADAIFETTTSGQHNFFQGFSATIGTEITISFYAKANGRTKLRMNNGSSAITAAFDLTAVTASMLAGTGTPTITSVGSGWYRCSITYNAQGTTEYLAMNFRDDTNQDVYAGDITKGMFFFGGQAETGVLTDYIATTTAAVSVGPLANVPRLDYLGSSCPRLLLEPQRTNLILYSEQFNNAAWGCAGVTITANQTVSPDGNTNADLAVNSSSLNYLYESLGGLSSGTYTASIFAKKGSQSSFAFGLVTGGFTEGMGVKFNFDTQTFSTPTNYANFTSISASYQSYGNGWYRLNLTGTAATSTTYFFVLGSLQETFAVNAYVYGAQVEAGAYATSYIPTLSAAVTRGADDCVKSSATSIIGQTEGVVYFEWEYQNLGSTSGNIPISLDGGSGKELYFWVQTDGSFFYEVINSTLQAQISGAMGSFGTKKIALAYKNNDFALYINGVLIGTDTSGTVPTLSRLYVGRFWASTSYNIASGIKQVLLFKTRLSNADLAALTA